MHLSLLVLHPALASSLPAAPAPEPASTVTLGLLEQALVGGCPAVDVRTVGSPDGHAVAVVPADADIDVKWCRLRDLPPVTIPWPREDWRAVGWVTSPPDEPAAVLKQLAIAFDPTVRPQPPTPHELRAFERSSPRWQKTVDACGLGKVARVVDSRGFGLLVARTGTVATILDRCSTLPSTYVGVMESWTVDGWTPVSWMVYPGDTENYRELRDNEEAIVAKASALFTP